MSAHPKRTQGEGAVGRAVNGAGVYGGAALMLVAVLWGASAGAPGAPMRFAPSVLREEIAKGSPAAWAAVACAILVATPFLRMGFLAASLAAQRRTGFALAALAVVAILVAAFALA